MASISRKPTNEKKPESDGKAAPMRTRATAQQTVDKAARRKKLIEKFEKTLDILAK